MNDQQGAIADYTQAILLDSGMAGVYYQRGIALAEKGDLDGAIADYDKAVELDPEDAGTYYNRGLARAQKGDLDEAIADYTKAINIAPNNAGVYYNRGLALAKNGDLEAAIEDFTQAIQLDPGGNIAYYAYINRAYVNARQGDMDNAVSDASQATRLQPAGAQGLNSLCWLGSLAGRAAEVLYACKQAVALAPEDGNLRDSRGLVRALTGDYKGAIEDFTFFIKWSTQNNRPEQERLQRDTWVAALQVGKNPFDQALLETLIEQGTSPATATTPVPTPTPPMAVTSTP
jgi:tetratricopeptide (TPR) repeat protein